VAGIGSSAGGVEALRALFQNMPADTGMAFILVSHLARDHHSLLPEIVARHSAMPVRTAEHGAAIAPNNVYVGPPNHILTVADGTLRLTPRPAGQLHNPIDVFLSSLAAACGDAAIGILLSGSGSDGALGIKAIKEHGGLTLAQGPDGRGPLHSDMPKAAIASGAVDIVAPVEEMPARLADYAQSFRILEAKTQQDAQETADDDREAYVPIYQLLIRQVGHDFSGYKEKTFTRRVRRRMQLAGFTRLQDYVERLQNEPDEVTLLFRDLLISVTNFFRDRDAFDALAQLVFPKLLAGTRPADTVRIWCPGCATGEEVYSIAILAREHLDSMSNPPKVQIFASDIDESALAVARAATYPEALMENVSPARRKRFFTSNEASYAVRKELRDMCIFAAHSVVRDPPFSRIDLISCRNLLIYLGGEFQSHVIPVLHYALREGGYLFLGTSENVTQHGHLFAPVDKKQRIFQRRDHATTPLRSPFFFPQARLPGTRRLAHEPSAAADLRRTVENRVMERFAPAHVVVNSEGDILHFSPRTGRYLEAPTGSPNRQLLAMARRGLRLDLSNALREAIEKRVPVVRENVEVELDDRRRLINLTIEPFGPPADPLFLVLFTEVAGQPVPAPTPGRDGEEGGAEYAERLEQELHETRERLQSTIEEYETGVEELKSSNEELQSINEEMQSTNEELETSKEELQSVNEELHTVNAELNAKVDEVDTAHSDLRNIFDSTQIATIFLDKGLLIRSFTRAATAIFNLIAGDCGRPLTDIASNLADTDLRRDVQAVFERGEPIERNVRRADGTADYLMRLLPYRGNDRAIEGVIVTFVDVTRIVEAEARQRTMVEELNHRVRNILTVVDALARQTLTQTGSPEEFAAAFSGRVRAMGAAYGLVSRESWGEVALRDIIREQLMPHQLGSSDRVDVQGPDILVKPPVALALGLVIHELTTNATKHGSLSQAAGRVAIDWSVESRSGPRLVLRWTESGGPPAKRPSRKGFGTTLIERELKHTLGGSANYDYGENGLRATLSIPFDRSLMSLAPAR
jgi:two-component system CheB/CheR fusion protein